MPRAFKHFFLLFFIWTEQFKDSHFFLLLLGRCAFTQLWINVTRNGFHDSSHPTSLTYLDYLNLFVHSQLYQLVLNDLHIFSCSQWIHNDKYNHSVYFREWFQNKMMGFISSIKKKIWKIRLLIINNYLVLKTKLN